MRRIKKLSIKQAEKILEEVGLNPFDKPVKYLLNRLAGMNKEQSALAAGYADKKHTNIIEQTAKYKQAAATISEVLPSKEDLAKEHTKVIVQDKDLPSKNRAIDMAYRLKGEYPKDDIGDLEAGGVVIKVIKRNAD